MSGIDTGMRLECINVDIHVIGRGKIPMNQA